MALHQLFTLAFALQLEPLPTLDYIATHRETASDHGDDCIQVGVNAFLEPIVTRHPPHAVHSISFLLQRTKALKSVEPWSELVALLTRADQDPGFKHLRDFFDARYDDAGRLIGADLPKRQPTSPIKRFRSASRSNAFPPPTRRPSQATEGRKPSFAQSIGGAAALKLNWLRKNTTDSQAGASHGDASDDEVYSSHSNDGSMRIPTAFAAPELLVAREQNSGTAEPLAPGQNAASARLEGKAVKTVRFNVRLDLHNVGLAPTPPTATKGHSRVLERRRSSNPSEASLDRSISHNQDGVDLHGGHDLNCIASPTSTRSMGAFSDEDSAAVRPSPGSPSPSPANRSASVHTQSSNSKLARQSSIMSKILDFGLRKRSATERSDTMDSRDSAGSAEPSLRTSGDQHTNPSHASKRYPSGLSKLRADANEANRVNDDEALDLADGEDVDDRLSRGITSQGEPATRPAGEPALLARRRSSNGSSGRSGLLPSAISVEPDLGPVHEDGAFEIERRTTRSSVDGRSLSAIGEPDALVEAQNRLLDNGKDFITLLRRASELALSLAEASAQEEVDVDTGVTTPMNEAPEKQLSEKAKGKLPDASGSTTPSGGRPVVRSKPSSVPSTPSVRARSFDYERSPNAFARSDAAGSSADKEAWWPCGEVDPLPVSISCALGQALGWEGIMQLCYGRGSRSAQSGSYAPLGRAAALEEANKRHERSVLAWRTGVTSADVPQLDGGMTNLAPADNGHQNTGLDTEELTASFADMLNVDGTKGIDEVAQTSSQAAQPLEAPQHGTAPGIAGPFAPQGAATLRDLLGRQSEDGRTWRDWMNLATSMQGWIREYETTRVRAGLAHEIGVESEPRARPDEVDATADGSKTWAVDAAVDVTGVPLRVSQSDPIDINTQDLRLHATVSPKPLQLPTVVGSPDSGLGRLGRSPSIGGSSGRARASGVPAALAEPIPHCVAIDATNRRYGFRRRVGIPEGLQPGPDGEEFADYSWSRQKLDCKHFATALTIGVDSFAHMLGQLHASDWVHASAWELDYLEMCVFKSPLVAERFPPPGSAVVPSARSYQPAEGTRDRTKLCPYPDEEGCWSSAEWKRWLTTIREGEIIVPAVGWQAWWTLISVLNGADRTGRTYDLQVKAADEPFEALTDLNAVYI